MLAQAGEAAMPRPEGHAAVEVMEAVNRLNNALERARHWNYHFVPLVFGESVSNGRVTHRSVGVQLVVGRHD